MTALTPLLAPAAQPDFGPSHQRADTRSNMFVTALLAFDHGAVPVRIRNMSRGGALIEAEAMPPEGTTVRLVRGSLSASGTIAWRGSGRAGVRFDAAIEVSAWFPRNRAAGQQRVDELLDACRVAGVPGGRALMPASTASVADMIGQLHEHRDALRSAAEELSGCVAIARSFPTALQTIDITAQILDDLASSLANAR